MTPNTADWTTEDWDWAFYEELCSQCENNIGHAACEAAQTDAVPFEVVWGQMSHLYGERWAEGCFLLPER